MCIQYEKKEPDSIQVNNRRRSMSFVIFFEGLPRSSTSILSISVAQQLRLSFRVIVFKMLPIVKIDLYSLHRCGVESHEKC